MNIKIKNNYPTKCAQLSDFSQQIVHKPDIKRQSIVTQLIKRQFHEKH